MDHNGLLPKEIGVSFLKNFLAALLLLLSTMAWGQAGSIGSAVTAGLTEKGLSIASQDEAAGWYKSTIFNFDSASGIHYKGAFLVKVSNGTVKVEMADMRFASGLRMLIKPPARELEALTAPVEARIAQLLGGATPVGQPNRAGAQNIAAPVIDEKVPDGLSVDDLTLDLSPEEARHRILAKHPGAKVAVLKGDIGNNQHRELLNYGEYYIIQPGHKIYDHSNDRMNPGMLYEGGMEGESIEILHYPGAKDLVSIYRFKGYPNGSLPTTRAVNEGLTAKYGPEWGKGGTSILPKVEWRWRYLSSERGGCTEDLKLPELWRTAQGDTTVQSMDVLGSSAFSSFLDSTAGYAGRLKHCGTILQTSYRIAANPDYVLYYEQSLVDYDKARREFDEFYPAFASRLNGARESELKKDAAHKPSF